MWRARMFHASVAHDIVRNTYWGYRVINGGDFICFVRTVINLAVEYNSRRWNAHVKKDWILCVLVTSEWIMMGSSYGPKGRRLEMLQIYRCCKWQLNEGPRRQVQWWHCNWRLKVKVFSECRYFFSDCTYTLYTFALSSQLHPLVDFNLSVPIYSNGSSSFLLLSSLIW